MTDEPLSLPARARMVLLAPDAVARTVAAAERDPERRWLLRCPRAVRRSFVEDVLDAGGGLAEQQRWLLLQDDAVRESYVADVLDGA